MYTIGLQKSLSPFVLFYGRKPMESLYDFNGEWEMKYIREDADEKNRQFQEQQRYFKNIYYETQKKLKKYYWKSI